MKPHLQCAEQQVSRSNLTKYCACPAERLAYLVFITYETSFTMRGATNVTLQTLPNTAPATQNDHLTSGRNLGRTGETSFPMRRRSDHDPSMKTQTATRLANEVTFRGPQEHFLL